MEISIILAIIINFFENTYQNRFPSVSHLTAAVDSIVTVYFTNLMLEHNTNDYQNFVKSLDRICFKCFGSGCAILDQNMVNNEKQMLVKMEDSINGDDTNINIKYRTEKTSDIRNSQDKSAMTITKAVSSDFGKVIIPVRLAKKRLVFQTHCKQLMYFS